MGLVPQDLDAPLFPPEPPPTAAPSGSEPPRPHASAELTLERIHSEHFTFIWRSLRGLGVPATALDDAAQQVFLVVHRRLPEFAGRSSLRTWLFSIAYRVALNQRRALKRRGPTVEIAEDLEQHAAGPETRAEAREALRFVERFLDGLPPKKRALFALALLEELPATEVAAALGVPVNTVYSRLRLLREEFRQALVRHYGEVAR
jgi:RNA polymerase sigma-70 factor (ECF subfamily)